jgi:alkylation response protein AidB-like acyl-CoA dehydrogenase
MDFTLSSEQQALADTVSRFCARQYGFEARRELLASNTGFSRANWASFAQFGWIGAGLSEEAGGYGGGAIEIMVIMEGFGRALIVEPFLSCGILALQTLAALPAGLTRDGLLGRVVAGEVLLAFAHGEAAARGDLDHVEARAVHSGGNWHISGSKSLVLGAPSANALLVSARTELGVGLFLVSSEASGLGVTPYRMLDNVRAADVRFDDVRVESVLAAPGDAALAIQMGHAHALIAICAEAVGAMEAAINLTRDYLKTRRQFGTSLSSFQSLQHRMADMLVELELSRSVVYQGLACIDGSELERIRGLATMKAIVSSAAMFIGRNAIQLHGGIGMTEEYAIGHYYRRLFVIASQFGSESLYLRQLAAHPAPYWSPISTHRA